MIGEQIPEGTALPPLVELRRAVLDALIARFPPEEPAALERLLPLAGAICAWLSAGAQEISGAPPPADPAPPPAAEDDLPPEDARVMAAIRQLADAEGVSRAPFARLGELAGLKEPMAAEVVRRLVDNGLVEAVKRPNGALVGLRVP